MDRHQEYLSQFSEQELKWLERLSRLSVQDTNLKAMRRMDVMTDMPKYCREHLHLLPAERSTGFYDLHISYDQVKKQAYLPGGLLGGAYFFFSVLTKPATRSLVPSAVISIATAGIGWPLVAYLNNRWYQHHIKTLFREIADRQLSQANRGFN